MATRALLPAISQGVIQSAFLWGYMATQLLGGAMADKYGGKLVLAGGMIWFSLASALLPAALSPSIAAAGLSIPAVLAARCFVVSKQPLLQGPARMGHYMNLVIGGED